MAIGRRTPIRKNKAVLPPKRAKKTISVNNKIYQLESYRDTKGEAIDRCDSHKQFFWKRATYRKFGNRYAIYVSGKRTEKDIRQRKEKAGF